MSSQSKYTQKLKGDKVLVIGGSAGIGAGVAEACLEHGCTVVISSSSPQRVQDTVARLQQLHPQAKDLISGHACNLGDEAGLEANIAALFAQVGRLDHVVFTAGDALAVKPLDQIDLAFVKQAGLVRFYAPLFVAKHAPAYLSAGPKASITLTTGSVSERPIPDWTVVNAYATGLQGMARGMALDLKPVRVNLVSPGVVDTELWSGLGAEQKQKRFAEYEEKMPTGKVGQVVDVAESYLYLMKDQNVTGAMISTSGGHLLV